MSFVAISLYQFTRLLSIDIYLKADFRPAEDY